MKIAFLYNPFSGTRKKAALPSLINDLLDKNRFVPEIIQTKSAEHLNECAKELVSNNFDVVVACGGDGTVNMLAGALANTGTALAIIPMGSGNGFARHMKIPVNASAAIRHLNQANFRMADVGWINGSPFLNVAGIGFDAQVSEQFAKTHNRGFWGYAKIIASNLGYKPRHYRIESAEGVWEGEAWMVLAANGSQWGNEVSFWPGARIDDGTLQLVIFTRSGPGSLARIGFAIASKRQEKSSEIKVFNGTDFVIHTRPESLPVHADGEFLGRIQGVAQINLQPRALKILV